MRLGRFVHSLLQLGRPLPLSPCKVLQLATSSQHLQALDATLLHQAAVEQQYAWCLAHLQPDLQHVSQVSTNCLCSAAKAFAS